MLKLPDTTVAITPAQNKRMTDQLVKVFLTETPPADFVEVVPGSIKAVDAKFHLFKALIHTDVFIGGVKQHVSNIRFKTDRDFNVIANSITFS